MLKDIIEERNRELDKCKICHGNGNNGADDASCLSCGGTGEEQKYSLKDFCIEFKDAINRDPELMSGVRNLMNETAQIVAREVLRKVREGVEKKRPSLECDEDCPSLHSHSYCSCEAKLRREYDNALDDILTHEQSETWEVGADAFERQG